MYNEQENAAGTLAALGEVLQLHNWEYQLIPVNDGSADATAEALTSVALEDERVTPVIYEHNRGRGYALRQGFAAAKGDIIASMDADLSYAPDTLVHMVEALIQDKETQLVLASPYMPGGSVENVPFMRLALSRTGNWVLRHSLQRPVYTSTGIVRAYRAEVLRALDLESDGKEIHLEILSQAMSLGFRIVEIPAVLRTRTKGKSKFRPRATMASHLVFSLLERSAWLFALGGVLFIVASVVVAIPLLLAFLEGTLNPERPLMTLMLLLFMAGAVSLSFSLLALQVLTLRRALVRIYAEMHGMEMRLTRMESPQEFSE